MRTFVAGAGGTSGARLVPQPTEHGHKVAGACRSPGTAGRVGALGADPIAVIQLPARIWRRVTGRF